MLSDVSISLDVQNNVNYPVQINIMGSPINLRDTSNATREYRWNVTTFTFGTENALTLEYKLNSSASYSIYNSILQSPNIEAVVIALNNLGIGFFNSYTELGQTYIGTYNQNYQFGQLNIYDSNATAVTYYVNQPAGGGNGLISSLFANFSYTSPFISAVGVNLGIVNAGDTVNISGVSDSGSTTDVQIIQTNNQTLVQTQVFFQAYPISTPFATSFVAQAGNTYFIEIVE
jgi:hypothetical protein